jgi:hypothetical protein
MAIRGACDDSKSLLRRIKFPSGRPVDGWLGGGCLIAAEAFRRVVPGAKLAAVWGTYGDYTEDVMHVVAMCGGLAFDAEGASGVAEMLERWALANENGTEFEVTGEDRGIVDGDQHMEFWLERGVTVAKMRKLEVPFSEAACAKLAAEIRARIP